MRRKPAPSIGIRLCRSRSVSVRASVAAFPRHVHVTLCGFTARRISSGRLGHHPCFAVAAGAPWPPSTRSKIMGECEAKGEIAAALCPCIADRMMATITWQEVALMALGRDGGAAVEAKVAASASHWARDCAVGKPQAPSRNP